MHRLGFLHSLYQGLDELGSLLSCLAAKDGRSGVQKTRLRRVAMVLARDDADIRPATGRDQRQRVHPAGVR